MNNYNNVNGNGGGKKFLYSGPSKKGIFGDEDETPQSFSFNNTNTHNNTKSKYTAPEFNIDSIWSIKKNVAAPQNQSAVATNNAVDGWDRNMGKGFYSRHTGNNVSDMKTTASPTAINLKTNDSFASARYPSGKTWPRTTNSYNYSYGTSNSTQANVGSNLNSDYRKIGSGHSNQQSYSQSGQIRGNSVHGSNGSPTTRHLDF